MNLESGQPFPFFSKLRLDSKILLFLTIFLSLLGGIALYAQHWSTQRVAVQSIVDPVDAALATGLAAAFVGSSSAVDTLAVGEALARLARQDPRIVFLAVADDADRPFVSCVRSPASSETVEVRVGAWPEPLAGGPGVESTRTRVHTSSLTFEPGIHDPVTLHVGIHRQSIDGFVDRVVRLFLVMMIAPVLLVLVIARGVARRAVRPLRRLTRIADRISIGEDPWIDFGDQVNCWEIKNCGRTDCKAFMNLELRCWYIDDTPCEGYEHRFPGKLDACRSCEVYRAHRGDEIVQLADAFKHMTGVLKVSGEEREKSDDFQRRLIRNSFNGVIATDATDRITIFNLAAEGLLGVAREEVIGRRRWQDYLDAGLQRVLDLPLSYERTRRVRGFRHREAVLRRHDGEPVDVLLSGISLYERGIHVGKVFFFLDMRELKRLREDLIRSERLAATGQAAAGISHSIRNVLDGFLGGAYVYKVGRRRGDEEKMQKGWAMIERNTEIISALVRDLLSFAKDRVPRYEDVDPAELIEHAIGEVAALHDERIAVRSLIAPGAPAVRLDPHAFRQCLGNLVRNAVEAIPAGRPGRVTVAFSLDGDRAVFTVADDGTGMSPATIERIRGGMYSTKGSKGTGLGLLVIQKIVVEHHGTLAIDSVEGQGSTFRIEVPASGVPLPAAPSRVGAGAADDR